MIEIIHPLNCPALLTVCPAIARCTPNTTRPPPCPLQDEPLVATTPNRMIACRPDGSIGARGVGSGSAAMPSPCVPRFGSVSTTHRPRMQSAPCHIPTQHADIKAQLLSLAADLLPLFLELVRELVDNPSAQVRGMGRHTIHTHACTGGVQAGCGAAGCQGCMRERPACPPA